MNYRVKWLREALRQLAAIWTQASDRMAVTSAEAQIQQLLTRDPLHNGQHVSEGLYRLLIAPLSVTYTIDQAQRTVEVNSVSWVP